MRRADRLFQIVLGLRRRRGVTADQMAEELGVSPRTVYRDIRDMMASGVPIDGEARVGYRMRVGFDLAAVDSSRPKSCRLCDWGQRLCGAGRTAIGRIEAVMPERLRTVSGPEPFYVPDFFIREAIQAKYQIRIDYTRADGESSERQVEPGPGVAVVSAEPD